MSIAPPNIYETLMPVPELDYFADACREDERDIDGVQVTGRYENEDFSRLSFQHMTFDGCRFTGCDFSHCDFIDVRFQRCDISGCSFSETYWNRAELTEVKAVGAGFAESVMKNLTVRGCNMTYSIFSKTKFEKAAFEDCDLKSSGFGSCSLKFFSFEKCSLSRADLFMTKLKGLDLRSSTIDDILVSDSLSELNGAVMDVYQAANIARKLGIVVK